MFGFVLVVLINDSIGSIIVVYSFRLYFFRFKFCENEIWFFFSYLNK